ncbi:MAG: hypothetical protein DCF29_12455 [Alphaproteobacteria bacterium]|nr:MAG: hypothetical protein DCF29_12455 [Alphaproteobacteria bacterium]
MSDQPIWESTLSTSPRSRVNSSRLKTNLAKHADVVRGKTGDTFRIRAGKSAAYESRYGDLRSPDLIAVPDNFLPASISLGGRRHLESLRREINGNHEFGFYNSCAVMCRRLMECLLIEAFDVSGNKAAILGGDGNILGLNDLLAKAKAGSHFKLSRNASRIADRVKDSGDAAAHSRHYVTSQRDIEDLNPGFRQLISELASLAKL